MSATAISCTQCGAGLNVFGGGRVRAHVCGYCGAELDAQDNYKVLRQFTDMPRPDSPFQIGMEGAIDGVQVVIIGTIGRRERHGSETWEWTEHQLFSPTHGYAWLSWEDGHIVFSRKTRKRPSPSWVSSGTIEMSENRPTVYHEGKSFTYYASGRAAISFVEGEFNWVPDLGDTAQYVSLLGGERMLDMIQGSGEIEYELSTLPDRKAVLDSFGIDPKAVGRPHGTHALTPFQRSGTAAFVRNVAFACAVICVVLALAMEGFGERLATGSARQGQYLETTFTVTQPQHLVEITLSANVNNSWAWIEAELTDEEDEPVAEFERGVEYYHGYDDGNWTEGSRRTSVRLRLAEGEYTVSAALTESEADWPGGRPASQIGVEVWQGVVSSFWLWLGAIGFGLIGAAFLAQRFLHHRARMAGSDWDDD